MGRNRRTLEVSSVIDEAEIQDFMSPLKKKKIKLNSVEFTEKQKTFLKLAIARETKIMFVRGPAGTSKTYLSVYSALQLFNICNEYDIMYVRTIAESGEKNLGSLPGDLAEKFNPFMMPLDDKLEEMLPPQEIKYIYDKKIINARPINFLRGANWMNKVIIADESQNFTFKELTTLVTRLGEGSKLFICGDPMQSDINGKSGFSEMADLFNDTESSKQGIHCFDFTKNDIMRSEILKYIVDKIESSGMFNKPKKTRSGKKSV
tara:strand:+ start:221 stop:1006 length:786 start_codon:yes stop_codon:yes gene_type:complete